MSCIIVFDFGIFLNHMHDKINYLMLLIDIGRVELREMNMYYIGSHVS